MDKVVGIGERYEELIGTQSVRSGANEGLAVEG